VHPGRLRVGVAALLIGLGTHCFGVSRAGVAVEPPSFELEQVAESERRWTGIAVTRDGRVFVNFPRWSPEVGASVAELLEDGRLVAYPDGERNRWGEGLDPSEHFVCVQSVHVDAQGRLWILDPANPYFAGVVDGGPKLVQVDLATDRVVRTWTFGPDVAPENSYLNDVRIETNTGTAFITDSGAGALVVLDLESGRGRRVLDDHPSTHAEEIEVVIDGRVFSNEVHADGIALDAEGGWLYYQALTSRTLHRVPTSALRDPSLDPGALADRVEVFARSGVSDGLLWAPEGVYVSALEHGAIRLVTRAGEVLTAARDRRIVWPDSFALGSDGSVWFTTAQIHLGPDPPEPFRILRLVPTPAQD
jgi:sugar lactone lactonase YvrE